MVFLPGVTDEQLDHDAEHQRLKDAVVDAAIYREHGLRRGKALHAFVGRSHDDEMLREAIDALEAFEAEH